MIGQRNRGRIKFRLIEGDGVEQRNRERENKVSPTRGRDVE